MSSDLYYAANEIISWCWSLFVIIWIAAAFWTKKSVYRENRARRLAYMIPFWIGVYLIMRGHRLPEPVDHRIIPRAEALALTGIALCIGGLLFCLWARYVLGRNWSGIVTFKGGHELITRGPYAIVRHPIYTGLLAMALGTIIVLGHIAGLIALPLVFLSFWIKLRSEEELMLQKFPEQYATYQRRVKRLIPFVL